MATADDVMDDARVYLNDSGSLQWTNSVLLPCLKIAQKELAVHLAEQNFPYLREISVDTLVNVGTNDIEGPSDMHYPLKIMEKPAGADDEQLVEVEQKWWEGLELQSADNIYRWCWRKQRIYFNNHTTNREVRIFYIARLIDVVDENTQLLITYTDLVLSKRTAAIASRNLGSNPTRADALDMESKYYLDKILNIQVKTQQSMPVRRRAYRSRRRWH
jgi:hypothetical protein